MATPVHSEVVGREQYMYKCSSHGQSILSGLNRQRQGGIGLDLTICVQDKKIKTHRNVLMSFSTYFEALLGPNMKEGSLSEIELHELDPAAVEQLIDFAYTSQILITKDNVQCLLETSNFLSVMSVCEACCEFLLENMDTSNCASIVQLAMALDLVQLQEKACAFLTEHFSELMKTDEFLRTDINMLVDLLGKDELCLSSRSRGDSPDNVYQETMLLFAVIKYVEHEPKERSLRVVDLLKTVRLPQVRRDDLELLMSWGPVMHNAAALDMVKAAKRHSKQICHGAAHAWNRIRILPGECVTVLDAYIFHTQSLQGSMWDSLFYLITELL